MARKDHVALGAALASAMRDAVGRYCAENHYIGSVTDSVAQNCRRIEVHGELTVGGPFRLVVECIDRRPGRSTLESYMLERHPKDNRLFRRQGEA